MDSSQNPFWLRFLPALLRTKIEQRPHLPKILSNTAWLFSDKVLRMGVGLFVSVWIARYLGPEDFGLFSFGIAFVSLLSALSTLGLPSVVVRDIVSDPKRSREILGSSFVLQIMSGITAFAILLILIPIFRPNDQSAINIVAIIGLTLLFRASESIKCWFESQVQSKYSVWAENAVFVMIAVTKIGLILVGASLFAFVWVVVLEGVLTAIFLFAMYEWVGGSIRAWQFRLARATTLLKHSWPLVLSGLAVMVYMRIDQIMLGQILNDKAVGIYTAAVRVSEAWYFIPVAIVGSVFPALLDAKKASEALYLEQFQKLYDVLVMVALAVAIPVTFLADLIVGTLFGAEYREAGAILSIHIWTALFVFLGVASGRWFIVENRQFLAFQRVCLGMVINITLNWVLIPKYGGIGAAVATLISQAVATLLADAMNRETRQMFRMKLRACLITRAFRVQYST